MSPSIAGLSSRLPRLAALIAGIVVLATARPARALDPGGFGNPATDCIVEYAGVARNYPPPPKRFQKEVRCFDGDPTCDADGTRNGTCAFAISLCFAGDDVPGCAAGQVTAVRIKNPPLGNRRHDVELAALESAGNAVLPTSAVNTCGAPVTVTVPATGEPGAKKLRVKGIATAGVDDDRFKLTCVKSGWTKYQHDRENSGSTTDEAVLTPGTVGALALKWDFPVTTKGTEPHYVTASPTVANGRVFVGAWNGVMYALRADDGAPVWQFDTADPNTGERGLLPGIQSSAAVLADGRVYFGAADAKVYCLDDRGRLLWSTQLGNPNETGVGAEGAHVWSSPLVFDGKVFVGRSSHEDQPCVRGRFYALDQDTGAVRWQVNIVPELVCSNAPASECATDADCGAGTCVDNKVCAQQPAQFCTSNADCDSSIAGNACVESRGGGITSSAALDPARRQVYITSGDCLQQGAIGDAESIIAFDMDTGARRWATRANPIGETADFDFIASPSVFTATDGTTTRALVGAGNKNGTYYAVDADTGALVWSTAVVPGSVLGGFEGSSAVAAGEIFSATFTGPPYAHALRAFDGSAGVLAVATADARTFAPVTYANGVVYDGSQFISFLASGTNAFRAFDAATGGVLFSTPMPGGVASGAAIVDGVVYVGYGDIVDGNTSRIGGVRAFTVP